MLVTWIGHSTVLVQTQGLNILTDPIWSEVRIALPAARTDPVRAPGRQVRGFAQNRPRPP
jgi:L-ascorbate metabolism protein UlaG (beta-lactamase superfamily)